MDTTTQAQIYLADQRGHSQTPTLRSFHTFNFGSYQADSRAPFGALQLLNDDSLLAGATLSLTVEQPTDVLLLPINGGLEYRSDAGSGFLEPGQSGRLSLRPGMSYTVSNPYEVETIDLLQIWLRRPDESVSVGFADTTFDLSQKNTLLPCLPMSADSRAFIGRYDGRAEDTLSVTPEQGVFVFVVQGVFEVQNRLLHERDGLSLLAIQGNTVEFEALSNDAILLLIVI
ncbi:pirin family protein [Spirosoma rhododendri]|uniref:Pirin n=1 Tax=Spirosoma rhododendri TaxID=2728024 RepID=A0A7L5DSM7_9BACT|nr:pirin [Spirosoma rhododendri]QJD81125.1 pirin [Spirosoma rhododendri]